LRPNTHTVLAACLLSVIAVADCGGKSSTGPSNPNPVVTPTPTPTPTPAPTQPPPCQLAAPTVKCSTRKVKAQELAEFLQPALDAARATPGVMYADNPDRIYDLDLFRSKVIERLTAKGVCGAWDYGNVTGDEIYTRSADGCVVEQYDIIAGEGGVRAPNRKSNVWSGGWAEKVPPPRPQYAKQGDPTCSLPGDRTSFCFVIKGTGGAFGPSLYALLVEVLDENPRLLDKGDFLPGQGTPVPGALRPAAWRILNPNGYIKALEDKIRAHGYCGWVDKGDILKVKSVEKGNIFHEEIDVIQNPASGGAYTAFIVKDRCHNAGF
jgi:hypothetical protein